MCIYDSQDQPKYSSTLEWIKCEIFHKMEYYIVRKKNKYFCFLNKEMTEINISKTMSFSFPGVDHEMWKEEKKLHMNLYE